MDAITNPAKTQRIKLGGPLGILLVIESAPLLERMAEVVRSLEGVRLVGSFSGVAEATDWLVWSRDAWHFAFVDLGLREGASEGLIRRLLAQPRGGAVVAVGDHLWREVREKCSRMGVLDLLEKGDVIAFRGYLEAKVL